MRSLIFIVTYLFCSAATITYPFAGILTWEWFTLAAPHNMIWGSAAQIQYNLFLAILTLGAWLFSSEPKMLPNHKLSWALVLFSLWMIISEIFSYNHNWSWDYFDRFIRVMVFILLLNIMMTNKMRVHAVLWVFILSIGLFAYKGGVFTILTGGGYRVWGPQSTVIYSNNAFGLALVSIIPFSLYLYKYTRHKYLKPAMLALAICSFFAALGTQSRGAFISITVLLIYMWWKSKSKIATGLLLTIFTIPALLLMPESWYSRIETIGDATSDASFMSRVEFWKVAFRSALDNPITGLGLRSIYQNSLAQMYGATYLGNRAMHSMYFEVMAGMGLVGFGIYMSMFIISLSYANKLRKHCRKTGEMWISDLALACMLSLVAFMVGGAAQSIEMWEGYLIIMSFIGALYKIVFIDRVKEERAQTAPLSRWSNTPAT